MSITQSLGEKIVLQMALTFSISGRGRGRRFLPRLILSCAVSALLLGVFLHFSLSSAAPDVWASLLGTIGLLLFLFKSNVLPAAVVAAEGRSRRHRRRQPVTYRYSL